MRHAITLAAMVFAVSAGFLSPASAEEQSVTVHYGELNLSSPTGQAILQSRLHAAAVTICGPEPDRTQFRYHNVHAACVQDAMNRAIAALPAAAIAQLRGTPMRAAGLH